METNLNSLKKTARFAGLLYFIWAITGIYGMLYISPRIIIQGDAIATAQNMLSHESLFRTGIINEKILALVIHHPTPYLYLISSLINMIIPTSSTTSSHHHHSHFFNTTSLIDR